MRHRSIDMPAEHHFHKHRFTGFLPDCLARQAKSEVKELFLHSAIFELAVAMVLFFEPIYLYQQGFSLARIMLFYLGVYILYFFLVPLGGKLAKKRGFEHSIFIGGLFLILFYLCLALLGQSPYFIFPAVCFYAFQKTLYWPSYHADFAYYGRDFEQGREISNLSIIISLVFVLGPLIGGAILYFFNFAVLFIVVAILIILSNLPLFLTPERFTATDFSYWQALKRLFKAENRRHFLAYLGFGEDFILLTIWPIFMFIILETTLSAGAAVALSTLITSLAVLYIGKLTDQRNRTSVLRFTVVIYALAWLLRVLVRAPLGVFLVDTYARIGKSSLSVPQTAIIYQETREQGVVKNIIFFEMVIALGKILAICLVLVILILVPGEARWSLIFIMASFFTLFYGFL